MEIPTRVTPKVYRDLPGTPFPLDVSATVDVIEDCDDALGRDALEP